jgi:hypothetical protein
MWLTFYDLSLLMKIIFPLSFNDFYDFEDESIKNRLQIVNYT